MICDATSWQLDRRNMMTLDAEFKGEQVQNLDC
jgi:hypothetical protein